MSHTSSIRTIDCKDTEAFFNRVSRCTRINVVKLQRDLVTLTGDVQGWQCTFTAYDSNTRTIFRVVIINNSHRIGEKAEAYGFAVSEGQWTPRFIRSLEAVFPSLRES